MSLTFGVTLVACVSQAALAMLASRAKGPLAVPLALLSADLTVWNFASLMYQVSGQPAWHSLDITASPLAPALGLHFVLAFVGRRRALARVLMLAYAYFATLAVSAGAWLPVPVIPPPLYRMAWSLFFLGGLLITAALAAALLIRHYRTSSADEERARTRLLLIALPLSATLEATDLLNEAVAGVPNLTGLGTLLCALFLGVITFRLRLFGRDLSTGVALYAACLGVTIVLGYYVLFRFLATRAAILSVAAATITFAVAALVRKAAAESARRRARMSEFALLGRFSAQMAHDLMNPLAALKGAAQFLTEERRVGRSLDAHGEFVDLISEQAERMARTVLDYQRMARIEPVPEPLDVGELLRRTTALQGLAVPGVTLEVDVAPALPTCQGDKDLLSRAVENILKNAFEAMPRGGIVTVRAFSSKNEGASSEIVVSIEDTGEGMDARTGERAFDELFTTKAQGSGLGLAFVRRVVEAHGGTVRLTSKIGRGTFVELRLPASHNPGRS